MSKTLYLDCSTGISGDMFVASMIDLGADVDVLNEVLNSLPVSGFRTEIKKVIKSGIEACDFDVILEEDNHDHDMEYLYGHEHELDDHHHHDHDHEHHHDHEHDHDHDHNHDHHDHEHHHHHHEHRGMKEITEIINGAQMSDSARALSLKIFDIIAEAESKAHGIPKNEVHFHEVGAVDSIVDVISAAVLFDNLGFDQVIIPYLGEGQGSVRAAHGILSVPVPAVTHIVEASDLSLQIQNQKGELVTPTGAAIAAAIMTSDTLPEAFGINAIGIGAGKRAYKRPSMVRAMDIKVKEESNDTIIKLESTIDDITGEELGYVMELLMDHGARDVHYIPVFMKKNRPAYELVVLCKEENLNTITSLIFENTTTIGMRKEKMERVILPRASRSVMTDLGIVDLKVVTLPDGTVREYPEYESLKAIAKVMGMSIIDVKRKVLKEI